MAQITDLQPTNTLGTEDQVVVRQGTIDKRISLELSGTLSWAKLNGYTHLGAHVTGLIFPDTESFSTYQGKVYFAKDGTSLPYTATSDNPSTESGLFIYKGVSQNRLNKELGGLTGTVRIGNISLYVGNSLPEVDKLNSYQYPDDSGKWYGPIQDQTFPITIPADPSIDDGWASVNALTPDSVGGITNYYSSSVNNMIDGLTSDGSKVSHKIGQVWSIFGSWVVTSTPVSSIDDFEPINSTVHAKDWGGTDSESLSSASNYAKLNSYKLYGGNYNYNITDPLDLQGILKIEFTGEINCSGITDPLNVVCVRVGGFGAGKIPNWRFGTISDGTSIFLRDRTRPVLTISGSNGAEVNIGECKWVELWSDSASQETITNSYGTFNLSLCPTVTTGSTGVGSWNNENTFNLKRTSKIRVGSSNYGDNGNVVNGGTFEGNNVEFEFYGSNNLIRDIRLEGSGGDFIFHGDRNTVICNWDSSFANIFDTPIKSLIDNGTGNVITNQASIVHDIIDLWSIDMTSSSVNMVSDKNGPIIESVNHFQLPTGESQYTTPIINVNQGDYIRLLASDLSINAAVEAWDSSGNPVEIDKSIEWQGGDSVQYRSGNKYILTFGSKSRYAKITNGVRKIRVEVGVTDGNQLTFASLKLYSKKQGDGCQNKSPESAMPLIQGQPYRGNFNAGTEAFDTVNSVKYLSVSNTTREVTTDASAGDTIVAVNTNNIPTLPTLSYAGVEVDTGATFWSACTVASGYVNFTNPLPLNVTSGSEIKVVSFVAI